MLSGGRTYPKAQPQALSGIYMQGVKTLPTRINYHCRCRRLIREVHVQVRDAPGFDVSLLWRTENGVVRLSCSDN